MNCLPKWICYCLQRGLATCWKNCPSWTEWTSGTFPYFRIISAKVRSRACPCEHSQVTPTDSRIFQGDRIDGQCVQTRLPEGTIRVTWDFLYLCLLVALIRVLFYFRTWCVRTRRGHFTPTNTGLSEEPKQNSPLSFVSSSIQKIYLYTNTMTTLLILM